MKPLISKNLAILSTLCVVIFTGCASVGPSYKPPEMKVFEAWQSQMAGDLKAEIAAPQILAEWWKNLNDPILSNLIERAAKSNLDLKSARARIWEARARMGISRADYFPSLDAGASATNYRSSGENGRESKSYSLDFDAAWEIDIFGGTRRSLEAAEASLSAAEENLRNVLVSLLAEVALNYIDARTYQLRLAVAETNLKSQQESWQLAKSRYAAGLSDSLSVQQAEYNLESTRSKIPTLRTGLEAAKNRLAVLLGEEPGALHAELADFKAIPVTPLEIAVGVPAEMLRRRPDIRQAERELAAQTAKIGVAISELYPKFTLSGSLGLEALEPHNLFSVDNRTHSFGPRISLPIFHAGAIRKNIEVQTALQEQALINYESTVLTALQDVENALISYAEEQNRRKSLKAATKAAEEAALLAENKYAAGLIDFNNVLEAERSLLTFEDQLGESEGKVTANLVRLYKALGGGWNAE